MSEVPVAPYVCQFDQTTHADLESLHAHIRRFKVSRERYYHQYYPRRDPITGTLIPFKDFEQYFSQEFESKITLRKWVKHNPKDGYAWSKQWLARRKAEKDLVYAPSQSELKTLCCPSMSYYDAAGKDEGGYYGITRALGYADRYRTIDSIDEKPLPPDAQIICDTREQDPVRLACASIRGTVSVGDYAIATPHDTNIRVERKSLADFCGTLSARKVERKGGRKGDGATEDSAFQRFDRELARAQDAGLYVVMMVEDTIDHAQVFNKLPQTRWIKASPQYILHNLRALLTKYPLSFQALFVEGRIEMARVIPRVLQLGLDTVKSVDLQYAYERKLL